jgi:hypothetical protein
MGLDEVINDLMSDDAAAKVLKKTTRTLGRWREKGKGPPVVMIGGTPYYRKSTLARWIVAQERDPGAPRRLVRRRKLAA